MNLHCWQKLYLLFFLSFQWFLPRYYFWWTQSSLFSILLFVFFCFYLYYNQYAILTLSLLVTSWAGHNTNLTSNCKISKTARENIAFKKEKHFLEEYSISFLMISRLIGFAVVVLQLFVFKVCGIIGISKIVFSKFFWNWKG